MKLNELDLNPVAKVRESTNFTVREIKRVCKNIGPRASGSENEAKAQEYIKENCAKFADTVEQETFTISPRAFMSWPWLCSTILIVSILVFIGAGFVPAAAVLPMQIVSQALSLFALLIILSEFILYHQMLDPFFKKATSSNVIFTKKPTGEVQRRLILSGHMDSAFEWRFTNWGGSKLLRAAIYSAIGSMGVCIVLDFLTLILRPSDGVLFGFRIAEGVCILFLTVGFVFDDPKRPVEGATDDLTGVFSSLAVLQFLQFNNISFEHTEVMVVSMGSEECGLRGSKFFAKHHSFDDVETVFIDTDAIHDLEHMGVYSKDLSGTLKHDPQAIALMQKAGKLAGMDLQAMSLSLGATDAASMTQAGVKSTAFIAVDPAPARYYHTRRDTAENLDVKAIEKGVEILLHASLLFDEQGLRDSYDD